MKKPWEYEFHRLFSVNFYKSLRLSLARMSFDKDFVSGVGGDPYPLLRAGEEHISGGRYFASGTERYFCAFFPYASYEITLASLEGACGFGFRTPLGNVSILLKNENGCLSVCFGDTEQIISAEFIPGMKLLITARRNCFEVYTTAKEKPEFICEFCAEALSDIYFENNFRRSEVSLICDGSAEVFSVDSFMDSGVSQADIRPVCYENGDIIFEDGKIFFTLSFRMQKESYQGVISWVPGTCEFSLVGAIFFNCGDGAVTNDIATCLKYERKKERWLLWVCSFSHGHVLGHCQCKGDLRFGVNIADITLMPEAKENDDRCAFVGFAGDEDPDIIYDEARNLWVMSICRLDSSKHYAYHIFEGNDPFSCDRFVARAEDGDETGGSLIHTRDGLYFVCGNSFKRRADYRVYELPDMSRHYALTFDRDDGGFRGWGSLVFLSMGTRTRVFHLTFDRHRATEYNWSYGNLYCFEAF